MKESIERKLQGLLDRFDEISGLLSDAEIISNQKKFKDLSLEYSKLEDVVNCYKEYIKYTEAKNSAEEMLDDSDIDSEMKELAEDEKQDAISNIDRVEQELQILLLPKDPDDRKNVFLEVRAGTGGDEAAIFAGDLFRIHTSACTVAVMPEVDEIDAFDISPSDLKIDTFRSSGAGGQHVNTTDSAIRITHIPTGVVVECQDERSQHKNKAKALTLLQSRILEAQRRERAQSIAAERKSLVGSGDRSERIRTYNYPQGRVTEHRITLTLYKLDDFMEGNVDLVIIPLQQEDQAEKLANLDSE